MAAKKLKFDHESIVRCLKVSKINLKKLFRSENPSLVFIRTKHTRKLVCFAIILFSKEKGKNYSSQLLDFFLLKRKIQPNALKAKRKNVLNLPFFIYCSSFSHLVILNFLTFMNHLPDSPALRKLCTPRWQSIFLICIQKTKVLSFFK